MRYKEGNQDEREYDACFNEINVGAEVSERILRKIKEESPTKTIRIFIKFLKKTEMNVYIYSGSNRFNATKSIVPENA